MYYCQNLHIMKNKITFICIFYCTMSFIISFIDYDFFSKNNYEYIFYILKFFNPIHFDLLHFKNELVLPNNNEGTYTSISLNGIIFLLTLLIGTIIYHLSNQKKSRLLHFTLLFFFVSKSVSLIFSLFNITHFIKNQPGLTFHYTTTNIFWIFFAYKAINHLNSLKTLITVSINKNEIKERVSAREIINQSLSKENTRQIPYEKATIGDRFLNYILDTFFVILIFSPNIFGLARSTEYRESIYNLGNEIGESTVLILFLAISRLIYYIISEGIFHLSPAKALTETQIHSTTESKLSFATVIGRSFSRLIPFEPFSFFSKTGWHDDLSNTTVLKNKKTGNSQIYSILFILLFVLISVIYGLNKYKF